MKKYFNLANVVFDFTSFAPNRLLCNWEWKLDPYRVTGDANPDVNVCSQNVTELEESNSFLYNEKSGFFRRQVFSSCKGGTVWRYYRESEKTAYLQYHVSEDYSNIELQQDKTGTGFSVAFDYLAQMMPAVLLQHNLLSVHGVLLEHNGKGIIVSADSGVGKTTHARMWRDYKDALIINGDRAVLEKTDKGWIGYGLPWSGTSGEQINRSVEIKAIVVLEQAPDNIAFRLNEMEVFGELWSKILYPNWDKALADKALNLMDSLLTDVPVFKLLCTPDKEAVSVLYKALEEI